MSTTRIYLVTDTETNKQRLIRAGNQAHAIRHAVKTRFDIEVAGKDDLVILLSRGIPVEMAGGPATVDMLEEATLVNAGGND